jgi:hypothetical protein
MAVDTKAARQTARKAGRAANQARGNPYVQRIIEDPELRDNVRAAYESARHAYKRMSNGKGPAKALLDDRKLQKDLREAGESLKEAADHLRGKKRRRHRGRRLFALLIVGAVAALIFSEGARKTVLDRIFGPEEEFEYSSTTSPEAVTT